MTLLLGDSLDVLKTLESNSVDSIVTDPPSSIGFMGCSWDSNKGGRDQWIAWLRDIMIEAKRVLKPGGHALVWGLPRTSHYTAMALEDAGFEVRSKIVHIFGTGFPKNMAVDKALKKKGLFEEAEKWKGFGTALKPSHEEWILCRSPLSEKTVADNVARWNCGAINIDSCRVKTLHTDNRPDKINECEKNSEYLNAHIVIQRTSPKEAEALTSTVEESVTVSLEKEGLTGLLNLSTGSDISDLNIGLMTEESIVTSSSTDISGNPSMDPYQVDMSCITKMKTNQITESIISKSCCMGNICHCITQSQINIPMVETQLRIISDGYLCIQNINQCMQLEKEIEEQQFQASKNETLNVNEKDEERSGRWPADLILSHHQECEEKCHDECVVAEMDEHSGVLKSGAGIKNPIGGALTWKKSSNHLDSGYQEASIGGASRFFYCSKASRKDRGSDNKHPTVKNTKLMEYLINLITPPNGTVLDPFAGSGSTLVAAKRLGFKFIGIEKEQEYFEIAQRRISE